MSSVANELRVSSSVLTIEGTTPVDEDEEVDGPATAALPVPVDTGGYAAVAPSSGQRNTSIGPLVLFNQI